MKKKILLGAISLLALVSCGGTTSEKKETEAPVVESDLDTTSQDSASDSVVEEDHLEEAVEALHSNIDVTSEISSSREYDNVWYAANYNTSLKYQVEAKYRLNGTQYVNSSVDIIGYDDDGNLEKTYQSYSGTYDINNLAVVNEYLDGKNTVQHQYDILPSTGGTHTVKDEMYFNFFEEVEVKDLTLNGDTEDGKKVYKYTGEAVEYVAEQYFGYATSGYMLLTLSGLTFESYQMVFEDYKGVYTSASSSDTFQGSSFTAKLALSGSIFSDDTNDLALKPVETKKIDALDTLFKKFDTNYTMQYLNSEFDYSTTDPQQGFNYLVDGEKMALDVFDMFSEEDTYQFGTLSYFDSVLRKDETKNKYYIETLALDEETYEYYWATNKATIESTGDSVSDDLLYFDLSSFQVSLKDLDSSLFTLSTVEGETDTYYLNENATKYFGKEIISSFIFNTPMAMGSGIFVPWFYYGSSWKVKIIDSNTIRFFGDFLASFGSASVSSSWSFVFTNGGTTDTSAFYSSDLPVFA